MFRRALSAAVIVLLGAALLLAAWPQLLGIQREVGVVQVTTMRGMLAAVAVLCAVLFTLIALVSTSVRQFAGAIALLLLLFAGIQFAVLTTRGAGDLAFQTKAPGDLTVLAWNTLGDAPDVQTTVDLIVAEDADIVVLPETSEEYASLVQTGVGAAGIGMQLIPLSYDQVSKARSTMVLISYRLGEYARDDSRGGTDTLPSVLAVPVDGTGPTIVGAHPVAPVPGEMAGWRQGLDWLAARCAGDNVIVAGDLNSTLDHYTGLDAASDESGGLGGCRDGARVTGNAAVGSWPTEIPTLLGAPIDHVMATENWEFVGFRVVGSHDGYGSDHRPVVAQLRPAG
ncbi:endonuclease/exonuclease/phosphatase family protein [Pseudolysinimonas sp.]|uniref:endonuclease/exonuclease/phosphatase family protein n=1 Tax=Pseudolysinimonas sp. TaxID=2680009 RepID=UPI00286B28D9|nr:endonuclease/exonuclease/phosphatase family protein [Pseudolysinimonas sp.]